MRIKKTLTLEQEIVEKTKEAIDKEQPRPSFSRKVEELLVKWLKEKQDKRI